MAMTNATRLPAVSSARYADDSRTSIIAVVDGIEMAVPHDPTNADHIAVQRWQGAGFAIADPTPPPAPPSSAVISDRQFFQQLAVQGLITQDEALAAVRTGEVPAALRQLINALPTEQRFPAEMMVSGAVEFRRDSALVREVASLYSWGDEKLSEFWTAAEAL